MHSSTMAECGVAACTRAHPAYVQNWNINTHQSDVYKSASSVACGGEEFDVIYLRKKTAQHGNTDTYGFFFLLSGLPSTSPVEIRG